MDKISEQRISLLHPKIRDKVYQLVEQCNAALTGKAQMRITQGLRTKAEQDALYAQGRTTKGKIVTNAPGLSSYHCYSEDTEILTKNGWKLFSEYTDDDVLVFNQGDLYYEKPLAYIEKEYSGEMISIKTRSVDLLVTPEHRMIVKKKKYNGWDEHWEEVEAKDLNYQYKIPTAGNFIDNKEIPEYPFQDKIDPETWWEFMGWYLSEGSSCGVSDGIKRTHNGRFRVSISQYKGKEEWKLIKTCLDRLGFHYNYIGHEFIINSKDLHSYLFELGNSYTKRIPRYILSAPKSLLEIFYKSMILGDGTNYEKRDTYWTVNKELANDFSEVCVLLGKAVTINSREPKKHILPQNKELQTFNTQYSVNTRNKTSQELRNGNGLSRITKEVYSGKVYCVTTAAGAIVVKRNGKVVISGNCYGLAVDFCLVLNDKEISWEMSKDYDGDKVADWMEVVKIFKNAGAEWGGDFKSIKDYPHFQFTFGYTISQLRDKYIKKDFIPNTGYVNL